MPRGKGAGAVPLSPAAAAAAAAAITQRGKSNQIKSDQSKLKHFSNKPIYLCGVIRLDLPFGSACLQRRASVDDWSGILYVGTVQVDRHA